MTPKYNLLNMHYGSRLGYAENETEIEENFQNHSPTFKFNLEKLRDTQVGDLFEATIGGKVAALNLSEENIENLT